MAKNDSALFQLHLFSEKDMLVTVSENPAFFAGDPLDIIRVKASFNGGHIKIKHLDLVEDDDRWKHYGLK